MAPSMLSQTPVQTLQFVVAFQSHPPQLQEHPRGNPFLKAQVGGGAGTDAGGIQGLPLAAGTQHVEDTIGAGSVGNPGPTAAEPMGVHTFGDQRLQHLPELIGDLETAGGGIGPHGWARPLGTRGLGIFRFGHCPSLGPTLVFSQRCIG